MKLSMGPGGKIFPLRSRRFFSRFSVASFGFLAVAGVTLEESADWEADAAEDEADPALG